MSLKILVVDDEPDVREVISEFLERRGMIVDVAFDGVHALEKIKESVFDLIITDIKMPYMRGDRFLEEAKKIIPATTKCMVMTGGVEWEGEQRALAFADYQLKKPFEFKEFFALIDRVVKAKET